MSAKRINWSIAHQVGKIGCHWLAWACLLLLLACRREEAPPGVLPLDADHRVVWLEPGVASSVIVRDSMEHFFERVRSWDMAVQLQLPLSVAARVDSLPRQYKRALAASTQAFTPRDTARLGPALRRAFAAVMATFPGCWPDSLALIKVDGEQYGDGTFYTRERAIIIPAAALREMNATALTRVMIHEVFHIFSRLHRTVRPEIYGVFGFARPGYPLHLPDSLTRRRLLNPDGINEDWIIFLQGIPHLPVVEVWPDLPADREAAFMEAYSFAYYPLRLQNGAYQLSEAHPAELGAAFAAATGGNTDYIIHPEEIAAENFVRLVVPSTPVSLTPDGRRVLLELESILQRWTAKQVRQSE